MTSMEFLASLLVPRSEVDRFYGVTVGIVTNNQDPDGLGRVKVKFPWLSEDEESFWARMLTPMAGNEIGVYFLPEVEDEVLVAFEQGQIDFPYILGSLWNGKEKPPESNDDGENNKRTIKSRSGHILRFDDTDGEEKIEIIDKSGENKITISASENTIMISAKADITIESADGKLILNGKGVEITSTDALKIEASGDMDLKTDAQMNIKGSTVNIN